MMKVTIIRKDIRVMFTGLIEEVGTVASVKGNSSGSRITIHTQKLLDDIHLGDSIAVDGVCTTVVAFDASGFTIEASPETLSKTTFTLLKPGVKVNLERPLTPTSRLGGHYVTGHVDGLAKLVSKSPAGISIIFRFELDNDDLARYVVEKGSIAISGISLTVNIVEKKQFTVAIIPHTLSHTNLDQVTLGQAVNIETDLLGKYVYKFVSPLMGGEAANSSRLTSAFLADHGFIPATSS